MLWVYYKKFNAHPVGVQPTSACAREPARSSHRGPPGPDSRDRGVLRESPGAAPRRPLLAAGQARRADPPPQAAATGCGPARPRHNRQPRSDPPRPPTHPLRPQRPHRRHLPPGSEDRWAGGEAPAPGAEPGGAVTGALSGCRSPPTRPAPPRPGRGLPLPLPLLRASRRQTRLGRAAHSASAIFSPPSGGGAAQARWARPRARDGPRAMLCWERGAGGERLRCSQGCEGLRVPAELPGSSWHRSEIVTACVLAQGGCGGEQWRGWDEGPGLPQNGLWCSVCSCTQQLL